MGWVGKTFFHLSYIGQKSKGLYKNANNNFKVCTKIRVGRVSGNTDAFLFLGLIYLPAAEGTHFDQYGRAGFFGVGCQHGTGGNSPTTQERKSLC